ncbi:MAG TPA: metallophosphoesterase family protein [Methylocella sp.]|nr:metallophosphoesterase family protein [Methylocella sp.]
MALQVTPITRPFVPDGVRIYAVGDIHGRADLLKPMFVRIDADIAAHPVGRPIQVFLGDYIDRGQDSAAVLDLLIERGQSQEVICLRGNHELYLVEFLQNPRIFNIWARYGGLPTLASYGLGSVLSAAPEEQAALAGDLAKAMPQSHGDFLASLDLSFSCGDFFFVHAGIRPNISLDRQTDEDLLWIRDEFLMHEEPFEKIIVHGHTPVREPDVRKNRINIDTGAYATGRLTCLRLERDEISFV